MVKCVDTHVHFRDGDEEYKETIKGGAIKAAKQGILAVGDMPNTWPSILRRSDILARLELARKSDLPVKYSTWVGLTPDFDQIREAVKAVREIPQALGLKLYAGESVGELGVTSPDDQKKIYYKLTGLRYAGVMASHCESVSRFQPELWDPQKPWTHGQVRPIVSEIEAVKNQIDFAISSGFPGRLHICHITCLESLELVRVARELGLRVSCEITPHHLLCNEDLLRSERGLRWKVNPPLRSEKTQKELAAVFLQLVREQADWIFVATDYAPHALFEKLGPPHLSGIANYSLYGKLLKWLRREGLSDREIEQVTYRNQKRIFGEKLKDV